MNLKFKLSLLVLLLWAMPRLSAQCLLPLDISMDSTVNLLWEQYLERGDFKYEETNKRSFERDKKAADNARLDSLFRVSRQYMVEQLGEAVFCKRVDMELFGAFSSIPSQFMVQYRFYYDKVSKDSHYHTFQFIFRLEESRYYDRMVCLPNLPNCRENPSFCQFKITHPDQAIQIAQEAGWIERHEIENMGVNDNWEWEMENVVNDHCGTNKIFVDMRTGERRLSEDEAWSALDGIAERVKSSPIVIEGVVLEEGDGYFSGSQPWISRIVEVNRIFKGDIGHGVIEVFGSGVRTTHGGLDLPPKGKSAIFFLKPPSTENSETNFDLMIDSLSPYPVFKAAGQPIELYQPYIGYRCYHLDIEKNLYHIIEKAAGQKRKTLMLPSERDSAFADFAMRKRMTYPQRQLGLEYRLFNKYAFRSKTRDTLRTDLAIRSPSSHSYLTRSKVVIRYSPAAYGDSIVSKNRLRAKPIQPKKGFDRMSYVDVLVPDNYDFEIKDLSDSTFQIEISKPKRKGKYFQVTPWKFETMPALPILEIRLPVLNREANLALDFVESQMQDGHFHFDFEQNKEVPYKYVWLNDPTDFYDIKQRKK